MNAKQLQTKFEAYLLTERCVSRNTLSSYSKDIDQFIQFLTKKNYDIYTVRGIELKEFIHYLYNLKLNSRSIARKISALKTFFSYLNDHFDIKNSAKELIIPKIDKKLPSYLSKDEVENILTHASKVDSALGMRNMIMLYLLYVSGMRVSELISILLTDINFETGFVAVTGKGSKQRMIPIPTAIRAPLQEYMSSLQQQGAKGNTNNIYLFPIVYGKKIKPLSRQSCWIILKKLCLQAGINRAVSPHQLRHSFATHMLEQGADLRSLQMLLGHENINTVQIYTHVETSQLRKIYDKKHPRS